MRAITSLNNKQRHTQKKKEVPRRDSWKSTTLRDDEMGPAFESLEKKNVIKMEVSKSCDSHKRHTTALLYYSLD